MHWISPQIFKKILEKVVKNGFHEEGSLKKTKYQKKYFPLIFDHAFARAFFGEGSKWSDNWEFHLQQMVIHKNPMKYLANFLEQNEKKRKFLGELAEELDEMSKLVCILDNQYSSNKEVTALYEKILGLKETLITPSFKRGG